MRLALILLFVFINLSANGMKAHLWLQNFQKVLIETLPVNRVYIIEEQRVFSFEVPKEFMNFEDTTVMCDLARSLGYSARPFWNTRTMTSDIDVSNSSGTKLLQSNWYWSFCRGTALPTDYTSDFCAEKETDDPDSFKYKQLWENTSRNNNWSRSLIEVPFINNPWVKIPHYEYRQCFRYSQSMFAALLRVNEHEEKRYLQVDITTVIPTSSGTTEHYFEYWATEYNLIDILRLKRLMNSIQIHEYIKNFRIYGDLVIDTEHVKVEKGFQRSPDEVVAMAKKIFNIR
jgi:hypothetical protein